jgi:tetratricopeptide (TPR) repeat protein
MGHYRLLVAYDDAAQRFYAYDSFEPPGVNVPLPYNRLDEDWKVFNRSYVPVYLPQQEDVVTSILGSDREDAAMWVHALVVAESDAAHQPNDAFSWFNVGTNLAAMGRTAEAAGAFDHARALKLPWRMLWYQFGPFEAYLAEGRLSDVMALANANLQQANDLEESHYYRGRALQAQGQLAAARAEFQTAVKLSPRYAAAVAALAALG